MSKLYPPQIEGTLPAFYGEQKDDKINYSIRIPYGMNKTVSINLVTEMAIRIKTVQSNQLVYSGKTELDLNNNDSVVFNIVEEQNGFQGSYSKFSVGQYYKVQIAYVQNNEIGYYSTVGIIKCTSKPEMSIVNMTEGALHSDTTFYTGIYRNNGDSTEKLYSYYFNVYDNSNNLIATSGEQLHNAEEDISIDESKDEYQLLIALEENKIYNIVYGGTTINGMRIETVPYRIVQQSTIPPEIKADITAEMNSNNGYIKINIIGKKNPDTGLEENAIGTFQILRSSEIGQYADWQIIHRFVMFGSQPSALNIKDFTVEQGKKYKYALQQYNNESGLVSDKLFSNEIMADFEDCFLYDGERQLKIKYNPKISSFKETLQEAKTNTLGGQYPFIFRNGKVAYKEFPISGLISYLMDEEHLFLKDEEMGLEDFTQNYYRTVTLKTGITTANTDYFQAIINQGYYNKAEELKNLYQQRELPDSKENQIIKQRTRTTQLLDYNQAAERIFKLKVLEFLNNGKPKLFRSASEGNYIVRLMNSSLAPNDQLGRMLHSFSTTATEVQEFNPKALEEIGIITTKEINTRQLRWETVLLKDFADKKETWIKLNRYTAVSLQCLDMVPGTKIRIYYENQINPIEIEIGITGAYYSNLETNISKIEINTDIFKTSLQGQITYGFYGQTFNHFDTYEKFDINDIPLIQFIGEKRNDKNELMGIKEQLTDIRNKITNFNLLHFLKREVVPVYKFTSHTDDVTETEYYTVVNIHNADIDYKNFTTNINLADWQEINDPNLEQIKILYEEKDGKQILVQTKENLENYTWINQASLMTGISSNKEAWYKYKIGSKGITSLRCSIPYQNQVQSLWIYYRTNLETTGNFIQINPANEIVFLFDSNNAQIIDLRFYLPPLSKNNAGKYIQFRKGYFSFETYWEFKDIKLEDGSIITAQDNYKSTFKDSIKITDFDPLTIYKIVNSTIGDESIYLDGNTKQFVKYSNTIKINGSDVDITDKEEYLVTIPDEIEEVYLPSGVLADVGVQRRTILYGIENNPNTQYNNLRTYKNNWLKSCILLSYLLYGSEMHPMYSVSKYPNEEKYQNKTFEQAAIQADQDLHQIDDRILNDSGNFIKFQGIDTTETKKYIEAYNELLTMLKEEEQYYYCNQNSTIDSYLPELQKQLDLLTGEV